SSDRGYPCGAEYPKSPPRSQPRDGPPGPGLPKCVPGSNVCPAWWWGSGPCGGFHVPVTTRMVAAIVLVGVLGAAAGAGEPGVEVTDGGRTIIYRARPGDPPSRVAEALGVPAADIDTLLTTKGVTDGSHVPVGFEYRVSNPLAARSEAAERRIAE